MNIDLPPDLDIAEHLLEIDRIECEDDLYHFFRSGWSQIESVPWVDGWCMEAMADHLQAVRDGEITRLLCNISPRCSKSNLFSVNFPAWIWCQPNDGPICGPKVKFVGASYASQLSLRDNVRCRRLIESDWYQKRWRHRFALTSDQNTKSRFTNDKGGERLITSIDGTNTGEGGMCFVEGTLIATPTGDTPIDKLRSGDQVLAFDHFRKRIRRCHITCTRVTNAESLYVLKSGSGAELVCTGSHKIYVPHVGYLRADELSMGLPLMLIKDRRIEKDFIEDVHQIPSNMESVYDIQVETFHNFFADGILVHNCILIDDPNSVDDVDSEVTIQRAIDWWSGVMPTRLDNQKTGAYIIIQQRTFENDLTGHILETEGEDWVHLMIPMRYEPERSYHTVIGWKDPRTIPGELMWPERFGEREVKRLEKKLGPYRAAGQLQQRPEPAGGGIIERSWWGLWEGDTYPPMDYICAMLDTAYTEDDFNDPSAMIVLGVFTPKQSAANVPATAASVVSRDRRGNLIYKRRSFNDRPHTEGAPRVMLMYAWREWLKLHDLVKRVVDTARKFRVDLLKIENKASGISVDQEIRRLCRNEAFGVQLYDPKSQDKTARLISVQHLFAEELVYAPDMQWAEMVITEVCQYPKAKRKDLTDCVSMGMRHLRDIGLLSRETEIEIDNEALKVYPGSRDASLYPA